VIVWPDGSVSGSVHVAELEEILKAQKGMSAKQLAAIGPVESLEQLLAGPPSDEPEPEPDLEPEASQPPKVPAAKKEK
jgi:hypothetical protein